MRKYRKHALIVLLIGALTAGIGGGITAIEFFSLDYGGRKIVGMVEEKVIEGSFTVEPSKEAIYINTLSVPKSQDTEVVYDEHVAENTVNYKISYNAEQIGQPYFEENIEGEDGCQYFDLYTDWEDTNEVANLFGARDMVLSDLKKGKIGSYEIQYIEKIELRINPKNKEKLVVWN